MPNIVYGEPEYSEGNYRDISYDYDYPNNLDLRPDSELHKLIVDRVMRRARESNKVMSNRHNSWREVDRVTTVYIPLTDYENKLKEADSRKPTAIIFPYSYSMLESLLTYLVMSFFQDPIFQYEGVEDDDVIGAMLLELVIKVHCIKNKVPLSIHTVLRDSLNYGVGIGIPTWETIYGRKPVRSKSTTSSELGLSENSKVEFINAKLFEGNGLDNIDPYLWLPDPSVSSNNIQKGEFSGWIDRDNYMNLLSSESESNSNLFNVKYLKTKKDKRSHLSIDNSDRKTKYNMGDASRSLSGITNPTDTINMYITLIPKEWKLGDGEYPEKWFFSVAADDLLIQCEKADHHHGMYPISVASPEFDGYSIAPMGRMEIIQGLQGTLDFFFNSHIENVRKAINDMLIVDPYLVNINDLKDPAPGKLVRLRRPAWGRGVDKVIKQLEVNDITRANISDSAYITSWMDRVSGADQSMAGAVRQGGPERLTKSEFQGTRGSAVSRLQRVAMIISMQFMQDIGSMFAVHSQQYMTQDAFVSITGRHQEKLMSTFGKQKLAVSPYDISVNYDLLVRDGSIPGGNFSEHWLKLFETIGTSPELTQSFDITRIFMYIAQQLGAKNVEDFKRNISQMQPNIMPDEQVLRQAEAGNIIPVGEM